MPSYYTIKDLREEIIRARESHPAKIGELEEISASLNIAIEQVPPINGAVYAVWEKILVYFKGRMNEEVYGIREKDNN